MNLTYLDVLIQETKQELKALRNSKDIGWRILNQPVDLEECWLGGMKVNICVWNH